MCWMKMAIFCLLVPLLHAHEDCAQDIPWDRLLIELNSLSSSSSHDCQHHYDMTISLCDPKHMLNRMDLNPKMLNDIMKKAESIYRKDAKSHNFATVLIRAQSVLTSCVHHSHSINHELLSTCFNNLEAFLNKKKGHPQCAWEMVNIKMRAILQMLQHRMRRKRRSARSTATDGGR